MGNLTGVLPAFFIIASAMIVCDFFFDRSEVKEEVKSVYRQGQSHNNASGNSHFSYQAETDHHVFYISRDFAARLDRGDLIVLAVSPIFGQINRAEALGFSETHSLRWFSGLVVPLACIALLFLGLALKKEWSIAKTAAYALLIADLAYLILA